MYHYIRLDFVKREKKKKNVEKLGSFIIVVRAEEIGLLAISYF